MTLIAFFVTVLILGIVFYLVENYIPLSAPFRTVLRIIAVVILIFLVLSLFHIFSLPFKLS